MAIALSVEQHRPLVEGCVCYLENVQGGTVADIDTRTKSGLVSWDLKPTESQYWVVEGDANSGYTLKNVKSGLYLTPPAARNGTQITVTSTAHRWKALPGSRRESFRFESMSHANMMVCNAYGKKHNGNTIWMWAFHPNFYDMMSWYLRYAPGHEPDLGSGAEVDSEAAETRKRKQEEQEEQEVDLARKEEAYKRRQQEASEHEKELEAREQQLKQQAQELDAAKSKVEEAEKRRAEVEKRLEEANRKEDELKQRETKLEEEEKRHEAAKKSTPPSSMKDAGGVDLEAMKKSRELAQREAQLTKREEELKEKEDAQRKREKSATSSPKQASASEAQLEDDDRMRLEAEVSRLRAENEKLLRRNIQIPGVSSNIKYHPSSTFGDGSGQPSSNTSTKRSTNDKERPPLSQPPAPPPPLPPIKSPETPRPRYIGPSESSPDTEEINPQTGRPYRHVSERDGFRHATGPGFGAERLWAEPSGERKMEAAFDPRRAGFFEFGFLKRL